MKNMMGFAFLAFALTGILMTTSMSDSFAEKGGNNKSQGDPQSCLKDTKKNPEKNPNCSNSSGQDSDNDGISDADEIAAGNCLDYQNPDSDNDGWIDGDDAYPCISTQH